jgi:tetratricopeptide (TPR) repeat protein
MMSQLQDRIAQFRKMSTELPDDELGHFRLGQLLMEAGEYTDAIRSFERTLEISPTFSKVYQLLGSCLMKTNEKEKAIEVLTRGWKMADERGDRIPREAMATALGELGAPIPQTEKVADTSGGVETGFRCARPNCLAGKFAKVLKSAPLPDAIGERIQREICEDCWIDWFKNYSIKVVNELRIDLSSEYGQEEYDKYMREFFGFDETA